MGKAIWESSIGTRLGKVPNWECCFFVIQEKGLFLFVYVDDIELVGKNKMLTQCGKNLWKKSIWENQHHSLTMSILVVLNENAKRSKILWKITETCLNPGSPQEQQISYLFRKKDLTQISLHCVVIWKVLQRVVCLCSRCCELANKTTQQLYKVASPCSDDHQFKEEELGSVGDLSKVCSQIVLRCFYLARIVRPHIFWPAKQTCTSSHQIGPELVTNASFVSFLIYTTRVNLNKFVMWETPHNNADWDCFRTLILPGFLKIQNRHIFVQFWKSHVCANNLDVQETNISLTQLNGSWDFSLDAGLCMDEVTVLDLLDLVIEVYHSSSIQLTKYKEIVQGDLLRDTSSS